VEDALMELALEAGAEDFKAMIRRFTKSLD